MTVRTLRELCDEVRKQTQHFCICVLGESLTACRREEVQGQGTTTEPEAVTCGNCKRTAAFKRAKAKDTIRPACLVSEVETWAAIKNTRQVLGSLPTDFDMDDVRSLIGRLRAIVGDGDAVAGLAGAPFVLGLERSDDRERRDAERVRQAAAAVRLMDPAEAREMLAETTQAILCALERFEPAIEFLHPADIVTKHLQRGNMIGDGVDIVPREARKDLER
jgi:hypothetical protein